MNAMSTAVEIAPARAPSAGAQAAGGALWTVLFSLLNKVTAFGGQIALAWFLLPADMGLATIALSIAGIVSLVTGTNLKTLLIQRQDVLEENTSEVFWLSLTMNCAAALLLAALAPLAGHWFNEPRLVPIILILAAAIPFMALPTIYASRLCRGLKFRALAQIQFGEGLVRNAGAVMLAALGVGASSLVWPQLAGAICVAAACRVAAGGIPIGRPHPRCWPALLAPALWLMMLAFVTALQTSGIIFVIGLMRDPVAAGFYAWGFALSSQAIFLLGTNLQGVFFPVFSKLNHDSHRQNQAFDKTFQALMLALAPVCALQIVLARPVIALLFHQRWLPAAPVVQWLSFGMITQPLSILGASLLLARGQYRLLALQTAAATIVIMAAAAAGGRFGRETEIARAAGIALFLTNIAAGWVACRELKYSARHFFRKIAPPVFTVLPLVLAGGLVTGLTSHEPPLVCITVTTGLLLVLYGLGVWFLAPHWAGQFLARFKFLGS